MMKKKREDEAAAKRRERKKKRKARRVELEKLRDGKSVDAFILLSLLGEGRKVYC